MEYSQGQISKIIQKIISKARHELELAQEENTVDEIMEKYGVTLEEEAVSVSPRTSKILVFGALAGKTKDYLIAAKKMGVPEDNLVFESDYDRLKSYDTAKLEYSNEYSDIIYGPAPHKQTGMGDTSSLLARIKREPQKYPRLVEASANGALKLSITSFKDSISKTRYFEATL
jgi:hypothetical protein